MFYLQLENKSTNFRHLKDKKCNRPVWYWLFPLSLIKLKTTINHPLCYFPLSTKPVDQRTALRTTLHQCSPISELLPPQVSFRTAPPARSGVDLVKVKWLMETLRSLIPGENPKGMRHVAAAVAVACFVFRPIRSVIIRSDNKRLVDAFILSSEEDVFIIFFFPFCFCLLCYVFSLLRLFAKGFCHLWPFVGKKWFFVRRNTSDDILTPLARCYITLWATLAICSQC